MTWVIILKYCINNASHFFFDNLLFPLFINNAQQIITSINVTFKGGFIFKIKEIMLTLSFYIHQKVSKHFNLFHENVCSFLNNLFLYESRNSCSGCKLRCWKTYR